MRYSIDKSVNDTFICFLHFDHIKFIPIYFDNASISRDKECVNLFSNHKKIASLPLSWNEFKCLRDGDMPLTVEVMA